MPNVVQVEFSHVNCGPSVAAEDMTLAFFERRSDDREFAAKYPFDRSTLDTTIRFHDNDGSIAEIAHLTRAQQLLDENTRWAVATPRQPYSITFPATTTPNTEKSDALKMHLVNVIKRKLFTFIRKPNVLVVKRFDQLFRPANPDERYELWQSAVHAVSARAYIFDTDDLFARMKNLLVRVP